MKDPKTVVCYVFNRGRVVRRRGVIRDVTSLIGRAREFILTGATYGVRMYATTREGLLRKRYEYDLKDAEWGLKRDAQQIREATRIHARSLEIVRELRRKIKELKK